jgi:uncharacterized metal-binding protein
MAIAAACPALTHLKLIMCDSAEGNRVIDLGIEDLVVGCRSLRTLHVKEYCKTNLSSACIAAAFQYGANLDAIEFPDVVLDDAALQVQSAGVSKRELDCIWGVASDITVEVPSARIANLTRLMINGVEASCGVTLSVAVRSMAQLQSFTLHTSGDIGLPRILSAIAQGCHLLISINISVLPRSVAETEASLIAVAASNPGLTSISLGHDGSDAFIYALGQYCPRLQELCILRYALLTDQSITALARGYQGLRMLYLRRCLLLTDFCLVALATCRSLRTVHLSRSTKLTEPGIQHFVRSCRHLLALTVFFACISDAAVAQLAKESGKRRYISREG